MEPHIRSLSLEFNMRRMCDWKAMFDDHKQRAYPSRFCDEKHTKVLTALPGCLHCLGISLLRRFLVEDAVRNDHAIPQNKQNRGGHEGKESFNRALDHCKVTNRDNRKTDPDNQKILPSKGKPTLGGSLSFRISLSDCLRHEMNLSVEIK